MVPSPNLSFSLMKKQEGVCLRMPYVRLHILSTLARDCLARRKSFDALHTDRDYLTGFSKRKNERRAKALKEAEEKIKKARLERRAEIRERVRQLRELNEIEVDGAGAADKEAAENVGATEQEGEHAEV